MGITGEVELNNTSLFEVRITANPKGCFVYVTAKAGDDNVASNLESAVGRWMML